jgi:hypothetical protein
MITAPFRQGIGRRIGVRLKETGAESTMITTQVVLSDSWGSCSFVVRITRILAVTGT